MSRLSHQKSDSSIVKRDHSMRGASTSALGPAKFVHITHGVVRGDSRVIKSVLASSRAGISTVGVGFGDDFIGNVEKAFIIETSLFSRRFQFVPRLFRHFLAGFQMYWTIFRILRRCKPDVVQCHDPWVLGAARLVRLLHKFRIIYDAHELESLRNGISRFNSAIVRIVERGSWPKINQLIVVSDSIGKWYSQRHGSDFQVIYNAPVVQKVSGCVSLRSKYLVPSSARIFIYVGGFERGRCIETLLDVFSDDSVDDHLVLVGYGSLSKLIDSKAAINPNIHVHERVEHMRLVDTIASADVGLCMIENISLSDYFCLPNKLFEYAFAGLPVLASDFPDISRLVGSRCLGQVCDPSFSAIKAAVTSPSEWLSAGTNPDLDGLSWREQEARLQTIYRQVLQEQV